MEEGSASTRIASRRSNRPVRTRRHSRRAFNAGQRPAKRLFTPEIKRFLKDWLVRRRDNPYPNRDEKKILANDTGLTYIQICNWFANWRRKLKNVNAERRRKTWGHLIKTYNDHAQGNVEQFSICSEDSIWEETDLGIAAEYCEDYKIMQEEYSSMSSSSDVHQCYHVSSTTEDLTHLKTDRQSSKMESCERRDVKNNDVSGALLLSKWLDSAARFQPSETNYGWWDGIKVRRQETSANRARHDRDEVEAAVALTALAAAIVPPSSQTVT